MSCDMKFDLKEALKRQNIAKSDIDQLREKLKKFKHVPHKMMSDKKLLCFLNACNGIDDAASVVSTYYEIRQTYPSIFTNRDPLSKEVQQCLNNQYYVHLKRTPSNHSVIYHSLSNSKASNYIFDEAVKVFFMTLDSLLCLEGPSNGLIIVFNMDFVGYRTLLRPSISGLRAFFTYLQDALPAKLEAIHVLNCVSFFDLVLSMIKPFMRADIIQKLHLHPSNTDYDKFYKEWNIPRESMPSNFSGYLENVEKLHQNHCKILEDLREYFLADEKEAQSYKTVQ
ncbi:hypothetical protein PVAND_009125 [Polypedilum vanderplanki]|uniref:CRAL-TRIO domain-containing protein n=1 Tax=Polypedilum vanderplanki TaxID=319348 RepID=A0A9J6CCB5_POLVA|nr:hypothetical protein PVAND_009125 [Polypedilum vanderplanki]